jgi:hypothetical protein
VEVQEVLDIIDTTHPSWPNVAAVLREFTGAGIAIDKTSAAMAVKVGRQRWGGDDPEPATAAVQATLASMSQAIVYYILRGRLIKIGTTTDPPSRFEALMPDEILAIEPGGRPLEVARHRQFRHLKETGEHFRDAIELRDHIGRTRELYGPPDPSWPTTANSHERKNAKWHMPPPLSTEAMTAMRAAEMLGIPEPTIRGWVFRGLLPLAGRDERRRHIFYLEHLLALRDSRERRLAGHR